MHGAGWGKVSSWSKVTDQAGESIFQVTREEEEGSEEDRQTGGQAEERGDKHVLEGEGC